jgi:formate dehydrogenase subunit gamma
MSEHKSCQFVIQEFIDVNGAENGALLPLLHAIQDKFGYIPKSAVTPISKALSLSAAEVHGVITFCIWDACLIKAVLRLTQQALNKDGSKN